MPIKKMTAVCLHFLNKNLTYQRQWTTLPNPDTVIQMLEVYVQFYVEVSNHSSCEEAEDLHEVTWSMFSIHKDQNCKQTADVFFKNINKQLSFFSKM